MGQQAISNPLPQWLDPQQASVFDPLLVQMIRKAGGLFGGPDEQIVSAGMPMAVHGKKIGKSVRPPDGEFGTRRHPAVEEMLKLLDGTPEAKDPAKVFLGEKLGGSYIPPATNPIVPKGFTLPQGMQPRRDPTLAGTRQVQQSFLEKVAQNPPMPATGTRTPSFFGAANRRGRKSLFTDDDIRRIRELGKTMDPNQIASKFPQVKNPYTIKEILRGDSFNWVK